MQKTPSGFRASDPRNSAAFSEAAEICGKVSALTEKQPMKRAALYLRVSTGEQAVENQRQALEATCEQRGWQIVDTYADEGISGSKGRDERPGFDAMLKDATRGRFDVLLAWSVDRLGDHSLIW
jgi:Resolvase, N terminal domain